MTFVGKATVEADSWPIPCPFHVFDAHLSSTAISCIEMPLTAAPTVASTTFATDERIACYCPYCPPSSNLLLTCRNAWSQISNSYFLNVIERDNLQNAQGIKSADNRLGSGQLEGCQLETLRCKGCTHLVGTRCLEAPPDKKEFQ